MPYFREFVMPLLAAIIVGVLVWAYLDRRLRNRLVVSNATCPTTQLLAASYRIATTQSRSLLPRK
jgi:hypothetical protein